MLAIRPSPPAGTLRRYRVPVPGLGQRFFNQLALTRDGLRRRDRMVFEAARGAGVPIVVLLAGGYARRFEDTVAIPLRPPKWSLLSTQASL